MEPGFPAATTDRQQVQHDNVELQHQTPEQEIEKGVYRFQDAHQGVGQSPASGLPRDEESEENRLDRIGNQYDRHHSQHGDHGYRFECGVTGKDQYPDPHHRSKCGEEDRRFMGGQQFTTVFIFGQQAVHDEDAEIIAQTENKGRKNNIDDVELDSEERHHAQDEHPADGHRQTG